MLIESPHHFAHLLQVLKQSLWSMILNTLIDFIHVYSPRAGTDNPLRTNFWCQQKALITLPICCRFKKNCFEVQFYIHFFHVSPYVYHPGQGQTIHWGQVLMTTERPFLFAYMLQVWKWSLRNLILFTFLMILYMYTVWQKKRYSKKSKLFYSNSNFE